MSTGKGAVDDTIRIELFDDLVECCIRRGSSEFKYIGEFFKRLCRPGGRGSSCSEHLAKLFESIIIFTCGVTDFSTSRMLEIRVFLLIDLSSLELWDRPMIPVEST